METLSDKKFMVDSKNLIPINKKYNPELPTNPFIFLTRDVKQFIKELKERRFIIERDLIRRGKKDIEVLKVVKEKDIDELAGKELTEQRGDK